MGLIKSFLYSFLILVGVVFSFLFFKSIEKHSRDFPKQSMGILDIRFYDFKTKPEPIPLKGEWKFYWKEYIISGPSTFQKPPIYLKTQETWKGKDTGFDILSRNGYASYEMDILLPDEGLSSKFGLKIPHIASSYRLYINNNLYYQSGEPGRNREDSSPFIKNVYLPLSIDPGEEKLNLVFEISNFENDNPGFWQIPYFGPMEKIHKIQVFSTANDLFLFGALVVMGFYHWGIYFYHKTQKSILYFSFFSYLLALRVFVTGERYILELFPFLDWVMLFRIEFLSLFLLPMSFSIYMYYLFPVETKKWIVHTISFITSCFVVILFFPIHIFTMSSNFFLFFIALVSVYVLFINVRAVINKREDSVLFLVGLIVLVAGALWDISQDFFNLRGFVLSTYGFLVFVFIQALVLSSRLALNFTRTESLSISLKKSNQELTFLKKRLEERVKERTEKLNHSINLIRKDLEIAKNIQSKIIPQGVYSWENMKVAMLYRPMDTVGGDIYDITEIDSDRVRIFLADALGHGVQAALLTMAIKSEYEGIKYISYCPSDAIRNLSNSFEKKFANLQTYFSCVVMDIDRKNYKMVYASAGHPNQLLLNGNTFLELPRTAHIIGLDENIKVEKSEHSIEEGDRIYLYSDGAFEQFDQARNILGESALFNHLQKMKLKSLEESIESVEIWIQKFLGGGELQDDLTMLGIEISNSVNTPQKNIE